VLGDQDALVYFQAEQSLWVLALDAGTLRLQRLPYTVAEIEARVSTWLADLDDSASGRAVAEAILPTALPPPGRSLAIVVDGPAARVPFAALRRDRFLVQDHVIAYAPSLDVVARRWEIAPLVDTPTPPVVLGDPAGDLPAAAREAKAIGAILGVEARSGTHADLAALANASSASLLHLAVHGGLDTRGAWLDLADGRIHAHDVLARSLAPRTVVLASCASAARRGRGLWGSMAAAFFAAGAQAVVAAAWSVDDQATQRFVQRFYAEGGAERPAEALAGAQRTFLAEDAPISNWGAFVLIGAPTRR
jgi:CHAT domain-containing protein